MTKKNKTFIFTALVLLILSGSYFFTYAEVGKQITWNDSYKPQWDQNLDPEKKKFLLKLSQAAIERTKKNIEYDPAYIKIKYPGGDVPADKGVCTDVIIRSYRKLGIDLQKDVHKDMKKNFSKYPKIWNLSSTDTNIDHRRVPNLMTFFKRHGKVLPITNKSKDYLPGDIVTWDLGGGVTHIGIVVNKYKKNSKRPFISHNIGAGTTLEDVLFDWKITGHFRYFGSR